MLEAVTKSTMLTKVSKAISGVIKDDRKTNGIYNCMRELAHLPNTTVQHVKKGGFVRSITIENKQEYVPDFHLVWSDDMEHYRVYIYVASREWGKTLSGYCICTIKTKLAAMAFVGVYQFLHKHRANSKSEAI